MLFEGIGSAALTVCKTARKRIGPPTWLPLISVLPFFRRTAAHAEGAATDQISLAKRIPV